MRVLIVPSLLLALAAVCCRSAASGGDADPQTPAAKVRASVARPQMDTVTFTAPALTHHCEAGRGLLVESVAQGNGLLVWLRLGGGEVTGDFPVLGVRDTTTPRGAIVAARYMTRDVAHGFSLDSGSLRVERADRERWRLQIHGSGLETVGAMRLTFMAEFSGLGPPAPGDSISCAPARG